MTRIRIATDGTVRGLWTDDMDWQALGTVIVQRASYVEFSNQAQLWFVRRAQPRSWIRRGVQCVTGWPCGEVLYAAPAREDALVWERRHFERQ